MKFVIVALFVLSTPAWAGNTRCDCGRSVPTSLVLEPSPVVRATVTRTKPLHATPGAHVDLVVRDAASGMVSRKTVRLPLISPKREGAGALSSTFQAAMPELKGRKAASVQAFYHSCPHTRCG